MMASLSSSSPGKPLRLKDFLKEDTNSDSCGGAIGFRTSPRRLPYQTVRYLLTVELGDGNRGDRPLRRCRSKGALTKLTAVINAVKMLPFASPSSTGCGHGCEKALQKQGSFLSRSFSRKLLRGFWQKRETGEHRVESNADRAASIRVRDIVRLRSFGDESRLAQAADKTAPLCPPSPVRSTNSGSSSSSCRGIGAWSDTDSAGCDSFSCGSSLCCGEAKVGSPSMEEASHCASPRSPYMVRGVGEDSTSKSTRYPEPMVKEEEAGGGEGMVGCPCHYEEEKDQLSPVSVMDFPFEDDDNEDDDDAATAAAALAASPTSFHRSLANIERTKHQLLQKIREFESLAALVDSVDLGSRFASSEDETEPDRAVHEGDDLEIPDAAEADDQLLQIHVEIEERAFALLKKLKHGGSGAASLTKKAAGGCIDELLVDFFIERLLCARRDNGDVHISMKRWTGHALGKEEEEAAALMRAAEDWLDGPQKRQEAHGWAAEMREMETDGRWRCAHVEEEEEEIAGDLGGAVLESLVGELVLDFFVQRQPPGRRGGENMAGHNWKQIMGGNTQHRFMTPSAAGVVY